MKNLYFLQFATVLFISLFSINESNAQCKPDAGVDTATCGLYYELSATPLNSSATAQWTVYSKPTGSSVTFGDGSSGAAQLFNTDVSVTEYGNYEFVIEESYSACTDYDTILIEFIRMPNIDAGPDQYICGWRTQMGAVMDPSGTSAGGSWANAPVYWTDSAYWYDTPNDDLYIITDLTQQNKPNAYITFPLAEQDCKDSVIMIWQEYSIGSTFTNHQCFSKDTTILYFYNNIEADNNTILIDNIICGRKIDLSNSQTISCGTSAYWIDSLNTVINWDPSNTSPNTTATVANYGTDAFAYVIENGHLPGSGYPVCTDTSEFVTVTFLQEPQVDACPGCTRLENFTTSMGDYIESARVDTVCFTNTSESYQLSPYSNIGTGYWTYPGYGTMFENGTGTHSDVANDNVFAIIFNSSNTPSVGDYYTLVWTSRISPTSCEDKDTLLLSIAKDPTGDIGFRRPYCHNESAKIWAEPDLEANPTGYSWQFSDNPVIDSTESGTSTNIDSLMEGFHYVRWNQTDCDSLEHLVTLQTSSDWGCNSMINNVIIKDPCIVKPVFNNFDATCGRNNGMIKALKDSITTCEDTLAHTILTAWLSSTLTQDNSVYYEYEYTDTTIVIENIPSFDYQINYGANPVIDSIYGLSPNDTSILMVDYISIITLDSGYTGPQFHCKDTLLLKVNDNEIAYLNGNISNYLDLANTNYEVEIYDVNNTIFSSEKRNIEPQGEFSFHSINVGDYLLRFNPKFPSLAYPHISTYYQDNFLWNMADTISLTCLDTTNISFDALSIANLNSGTNSAEGYIKYNSSLMPFENARVFLRDSISSEVVQYTTSDINGFFSFNSIDSGSYYFSVDIMGLPQNSTHYINTATNSAYQYQNFLVDTIVTSKDTSSFGINADYSTSSIEQLDNFKIISIYPNPVKDKIQIIINNKDLLNKEIEIIDIDGKKVSSIEAFRNISSKTINVSILQNGIYFIKIGDHTEKFVKLK